MANENFYIHKRTVKYLLETKRYVISGDHISFTYSICPTTELIWNGSNDTYKSNNLTPKQFDCLLTVIYTIKVKHKIYLHFGEDQVRIEMDRVNFKKFFDCLSDGKKPKVDRSAKYEIINNSIKLLVPHEKKFF